MKLNNIIFAMAGSFVLLSLVLGASGSPIYQHEYWLFLAAFVGLNLFQSAFTGFCPAAMILKKLGVQE
ncbi:YgaP family membrane protein [Candidatus Venteria ishoeyi]|uniref:Inner membrane protein YgaP-like transmembrane domain-containing protein n=1 Tax=Candidatus Venteria ishoeyi TaxID=1899563 RepID=A0A1H6FD93_9GAMM|nr:DUF2892 domain-containing protein [Candidatus Venteria ishoeyi]MDM8545005.1 DUF2892 domain-containing protein [Candidatus Venteria ishoeyi]SEH06995.1 Uncharacterised protein [Candidatus Venteria ishoeyi]